MVGEEDQLTPPKSGDEHERANGEYERSRVANEKGSEGGSERRRTRYLPLEGGFSGKIE
jgi:hypothetical protein